MKCQRIYTEDKNRRELETIVGQYFSDYSIYQQDGYWKGKREVSLVIEVISRTHQRANIYRLAHKIKAMNAQEAVLITSYDIEGDII